jgi:hypothetical protein
MNTVQHEQQLIRSHALAAYFLKHPDAPVYINLLGVEGRRSAPLAFISMPVLDESWNIDDTVIILQPSFV